jgi:hypothetical protein
MNKQALIGSGFYSDEASHAAKMEFFENIWLKNVGARDIVIVDNSESRIGITESNWFRIVRIEENLGHVGSFIGQYRPILLGWSMSWLIPAMIAYSENRDFIYFESDALAFGDWEQSILDDAKQKNLSMAYGAGSKWACCEQSIFWIQHDFIIEAIWKYLSIPEGDGMVLPEDKFRIMSERDMRVGMFSMGCGRNRPLPLDEKTWFSQKFDSEELLELKKRGLI